MPSIYEVLRDALRSELPVALVTVIDGAHVGATLLLRPYEAPLGSLGDPDLDRVAGRDALAELESGRTGVRHYGEQGQANETAVSVFIESFALPPRMSIFGAVDFTAALAKVAKVLGYRVTVCDAPSISSLPTRVLPVKLILRRRASLSMVCAMLAGSPLMQLITPAGAPDSCSACARIMAERGVYSEGRPTTVQPAAIE